MKTTDPGEHGRGALSAGLAYFFWGIVPLYWQFLRAVPAPELIAHRLVWSLAVLLPLVAGRGRWSEFVRSLRSWRSLGWHALSGAFLAINWLVYVWAVLQGRVIECSLGYFLVPLFNVLLGRLAGESLRPLQRAAILLAGLGVAVLVFLYGGLPWVALALAGSFGLYGLLRKRSPLGAVTGLAVETAVLLPVALAYLGWAAWRGSAAFVTADASAWLWLLAAGPVTTLPLLLFAYGARRVSFTALGLLQYIGPTCTFLLGVWLYREPVAPARLAAFALIWAALALYTLDAWRRREPRAKEAT